ncbi:hypothetical protein HMPREF3214_00392 [Alloscardovia omnicolens]|nr:hypothetical protein HMPREF3214_00392 [Alloscardovia omnicolens]
MSADETHTRNALHGQQCALHEMRKKRHEKQNTAVQLCNSSIYAVSLS